MLEYKRSFDKLADIINIGRSGVRQAVLEQVVPAKATGCQRVCLPEKNTLLIIMLFTCVTCGAAVLKDSPS